MNRTRSKKGQGQKGAPAWMTTFSDLMTLILVFFILLYSFSEIDATKFRTIANSFKGIFDNQQSLFLDYPESSPIEYEAPPKDLQDQERIEGKDTDDQKAQNNQQLDELLYKIKTYLKEHQLEAVILATREERGVVLVLQENVLFDSGRAAVKQQAKPFLAKVADLIATLPNMVEVEGHTDSQRIIQPSQYTSNWNLAGDRAANVANYFINEQKFPADRFKISGYADTQPVDTNATEEGRLKNRRVVIVILDDEDDSGL